MARQQPIHVGSSRRVVNLVEVNADGAPDAIAAQPAVGDHGAHGVVGGPGSGVPGAQGHSALTKWIAPARHRAARDHNDTHTLDELELFRKDVGPSCASTTSCPRSSTYEDTSLEKLSIYLRHLAPQISSQQLNHDIYLSTIDFEYIAQH